MALADDLYKVLEPYMTEGKMYKFEAIILPPGMGFVIVSEKRPTFNFTKDHPGEKINFMPWPQMYNAQITEVVPAYKAGLETTGDPIKVKIR